MKVCEQLKRRGWPITQYIMEGMMVAHDYELSRMRDRFAVVNDKNTDAAYNKSIRDNEVANTVSRIERLAAG